MRYDIEYWKQFYASFKPCYRCGSESVDIEYEDAIVTRAYGQCYDCGERTPSAHTDEEARDIWNKEWETKATKLMKYLTGKHD